MEIERETTAELKIRGALLGQRQDQIDASIALLDKRLCRMEVSLQELGRSIAKWAGMIAALSACMPFLAGMI